MYGLIVGECGVSPSYFLTQMGQAEVADYLSGYARRARFGWEQSRLVCEVVAKAAGAKGDLGIVFPWEKEETAARKDPDGSELERLRTAAKQLEGVIAAK